MTYNAFRLLEVANLTVFSRDVEEQNSQREKDTLARIETMRTEACDLIEDEEQRQAFLELLDQRAHLSQKRLQLLEQHDKEDAASREALQSVIDQWTKTNQKPDWEQTPAH